MTSQQQQWLFKQTQSVLSEFPDLVLGGTHESLEKMRHWRFAIDTQFESVGPTLTNWWAWVWTQAENAHAIYLRTSIRDREGISIQDRCPEAWKQVNAWVKPHVLKAVPKLIRDFCKQRQDRGIRDEVQDILFAVCKQAGPGGHAEKDNVLS